MNSRVTDSLSVQAAFPIMTVLTEAGSSKVRNANPRDLPSASRTMVHASTMPNSEQ